MPKVPGKESKSKVEDWMVDSVVGFLSSPLWTTPVMNFIEQHCIVFDNEEENKFVYTEIHEKYRKLVETLIEGYLEELKITPKQFLKACERASPEHPQYDKVVFETVLAADDFLTFKQLMVAMNMSLEMQALKLLYELYGIVLDAADQAVMMGMSADDAARLGLNQRATDDRLEEEERILDEAIRLSKAAYDRHVRDAEDEHDEMRRVIEESLAESERLARKAQRIQEEFDRELERAIRLSLQMASKHSGNDDGAVVSGDDSPKSRRRHGDKERGGRSEGRHSPKQSSRRGKDSGDEQEEEVASSDSDGGVVVTSSMRDVSESKGSSKSPSGVAAGHKLPRPPSGRRSTEGRRSREGEDGRRSRGDDEGSDLDLDDVIEGRTASKGKRRSSEGASEKSSKSKSPSVKASELGPVRGGSRPTSAKGNATSNWLARAKEEAAALEEHKKAPKKFVGGSAGSSNEEDVEMRARHMREQRDRLLEFKRQQREKLLQKYAEKNNVADLSDAVRQRVEDLDSDAKSAPMTKEEEERMALRRALAMKLKQDVIENAQINTRK